MMSRFRRTLLALQLLTAAGAPVIAAGQTQAQGVEQYPAQATFPKEDRSAVSRHLAQARQIAGDDLWSEFRWRCLISPLDSGHVRGVQHDGIVPPTKIFDELYSIGQNAVSAYAINTSEGIILIDALNNPEEAEKILVPNLIALGLDPARIKYVIVTHGHGDHYGGAKYLQDTYGARVIASAADWDAIYDRASMPAVFRSLEPPRHDIVVEDGQNLTLGATKVRFHVTPGHTAGTLSLIFPVHDNGVKHMAGMMGGTGGGRDVALARTQIKSLERWQEITAQSEVDVLLTNHPAHMDATEKQVLLRYGATGGANPFIYGPEKYQRYMQTMSECSRVWLARAGEPSQD